MMKKSKNSILLNTFKTEHLKIFMYYIFFILKKKNYIKNIFKIL